MPTLNSIELNVACKIINREEDCCHGSVADDVDLRDVSQNRRSVHKDAIIVFNAVRCKA